MASEAISEFQILKIFMEEHAPDPPSSWVRAYHHPRFWPHHLQIAYYSPDTH